jgi:ATP-dependent exoDNAse (exonuclease V) alpha subunit
MSEHSEDEVHLAMWQAEHKAHAKTKQMAREYLETIVGGARNAAAGHTTGDLADVLRSIEQVAQAAIYHLDNQR